MWIFFACNCVCKVVHNAKHTVKCDVDRAYNNTVMYNVYYY